MRLWRRQGCIDIIIQSSLWADTLATIVGVAQNKGEYGVPWFFAYVRPSNFYRSRELRDAPAGDGAKLIVFNA
jgi:hypothetical protein